MSARDTGRVIAGRARTPEDEIRLALYADVRQAGADPSTFLDELAAAVADAPWLRLDLTFKQFIEEPFPVGIGSSLDVVTKLARLPHRHEDAIPEKRVAMAAMRQRVRQLAEEAGPVLPENGELGGGHTSLDISKLPGSGQGGTSRAYNLARLKRDRPDLADMVINGALSANAAAIEAGFRKRPTPAEQVRSAWRKLSEDERAAFLAEIAPD